jgi:hypothetical protein
MLVSGDKHDVFSLDSISWTDTTGSRSSIQIRDSYYNNISCLCLQNTIQNYDVGVCT